MKMKRILCLLLSAVMIKSPLFRKLVCGRPIVVINKGKIVQTELKRLRMSIDELWEELRSKDVFSLDDVYYFDSTDERTFIYLASEVYECDMKLYELEQQLADTNFVRISKSCIVNIIKLDSVRPLINSRYEAKLENGEKLIINRHYLPGFKRKFGI